MLDPESHMARTASVQRFMWCAAISACGIIAAGFAFVDALNGCLWVSAGWLHVLAFCLSVLSLAMSYHESVNTILARYPGGLADRWNGLQNAERMCRTSIQLVLMLGVACLFVRLLLAYNLGTPDSGPILRQRSIYQLNNHGILTDVPRWKFIAVGALFHAGSSFVCMALGLFGIRRALFGKATTDE